MPGLGASFGRGAATTYQQDLANSDCILFMGSNMAEAHPVGFRWPMKAKERGATLIHVDPRFTRTSALCDVHVGIRAGSDVAFLGGLVNYVLSHDRWFREYVVHYTNAATIGGAAPTPTYSELHSFYLLVDRPSVYGLPDAPFNPWLRMKGDYARAVACGLAAIAALLPLLLLAR